MRLKAGDRIQLQPPVWAGQGRHVVKLIGYLDNVDLLVSAPLENGMPVPLRENDRVIARYFSSEKAFGFSCTVQRVCKIPYHYLHLSFPDRIQGAVIRKSPRIRTQLVASIAKPGSDDSAKSGTIINLSANGAMLKTQQPLLRQGEKIQLAFRVRLHNVGAHLALNAMVRSMLRDEPKNGLSEASYNYGLQFQDLPPNDSVILQSLVYQQMIEQPQSLT
jgi:c-di-GMP-binding flagellar brake protein YcgR